MIIRRYQHSDFETVVALWRASRTKAFPYIEAQQGYSLDDDKNYFRSVILKKFEVWLAEQDGKILGLMAIKDGFIDQLFVDPQAQSKGVGTALLLKARQLSPKQLRAYTFQKNKVARNFFEKHGFLITGAGLSPAPENEPDLEYYWSPQGWTTRMTPGHIRPIAICLFLHQEQILVFEARDPVKNETFYRPLGGQIEFGEHSSGAVRREIREEIRAEIVNLRYLQTLENTFTLNGQAGHEIVFVYQADLADPTFYEKKKDDRL